MYQVVGTDGQVYGPHDVVTLKQWAEEGRLTRNTTIIDPITGNAGTAGMLLKDDDVFPLAVPPVVASTPLVKSVGAPQMTGGLSFSEFLARFGGYLLDQLIILPVVLLAAIPFVGLLLSPLVLLYWLSRDAAGGRSIGKRVTGNQVVRLDGGPVGWGHSALRNIVFAVVLLEMLPVVGVFAWGVTHLVISLVEIILVLSTRRRIGDYLAGTVVVPVSSISSAPSP